MDESVRKMIDKQFADLPEAVKAKVALNTMYEAVPSAECPSGTRGRVPVYEMFAVDKEMQQIILKSPTEADIYAAARAKGMLTMREDAIIKNLKGEVPIQEVYTLAGN